MARGRKWLAGVLASTFVVAGMTVVSAAPAGAAAGNTSLTCTRVESDPDAGGVPTIKCDLSDPDGIRTMLLVTTDPRTSGGSDLSFLCQFPDPPTTSNLTVWNAPRFRLFVTDCDQPRNHANYVIRPDGTVREIRDN